MDSSRLLSKSIKLKFFEWTFSNVGWTYKSQELTAYLGLYLAHLIQILNLKSWNDFGSELYKNYIHPFSFLFQFLLPEVVLAKHSEMEVPKISDQLETLISDWFVKRLPPHLSFGKYNVPMGAMDITNISSQI